MGDLKYKNRRADLVFNCLAVREEVHYAEFDSVVDPENSVRAMRGIVSEKTESSLTLQCVPLYTLLLALENPTVNWFILDIEGAEYQVLQTIPWHLVDIEMISVETDLAGLVMPGSRQEIIHYMKSQGYVHRREVLRAEESLRLFTCRVHGSTSTVGEVKDDLFVRSDVYQRYHKERDEL